MFSRSLEVSLNDSFVRAREKRHEFITVEHLLLTLLENNEASDALVACGANLDRLRAGLGIFIEETTPHIPYDSTRDIQPTLSFQRVLQRAIYQVQSNGQVEVTGVHVLTAIFGEQESQSVYFLSQENITRIDIINYISNGISKEKQRNDDFNLDQNQSPFSSNSDAQQAGAELGADDETMLETYTVNLNRRAMQGKIDTLIGREAEIQRCMQVLCRRSKNNPLFVGEAGVGKTALAEGLAKKIVDHQVPQSLRHCVIYSLDLGVLLAGTKYRGDFEKRFKSVLNILAKQSNAIVFIDEIHNLIGAGSATGGTMDASNLIKPLLTTGELCCIGATTYEEYRSYFSKDTALMRRFQKIDVVEPNCEETFAILKGLQSKLESYHNVTYTEEALRSAVELGNLYLNDRHFPDKAIDIVDEAGAEAQLDGSFKRKQVIDKSKIEKIIASMARVPIDAVNQSMRRKLINLPKKLKNKIYGQDDAIIALSDAIRLSRSGLREEHKPVGSLLFAGPTGVGKTEVCKELAANLGVPLVRFDMSEYMEAHAVSRLIGAPPGYVGYDKGGLLTEAIIKEPHCVLLLDEIEKAHQDLYSILLQVMDYGSLTDNNGRQADFSHVTIIMTTNAGAQQMEKGGIGFADKDYTVDGMESLSRVFTPEFRNRLDGIIQFKHLDIDVIHKVVAKNLHNLAAKLKKQDIKLNITAPAKDWLAKNGYDRNMGARPIERLINIHIKKPIAEELLFNELETTNKMIKVSLSDNKIRVEFVTEKKKDIDENSASNEESESSEIN
jgi:ATP-dependent Clp protease ATP-binding subunit ClpA